MDEIQALLQKYTDSYKQIKHENIPVVDTNNPDKRIKSFISEIDKRICRKLNRKVLKFTASKADVSKDLVGIAVKGLKCIQFVGKQFLDEYESLQYQKRVVEVVNGVIKKAKESIDNRSYKQDFHSIGC